MPHARTGCRWCRSEQHVVAGVWRRRWRRARQCQSSLVMLISEMGGWFYEAPGCIGPGRRRGFSGSRMQLGKPPGVGEPGPEGLAARR